GVIFCFVRRNVAHAARVLRPDVLHVNGLGFPFQTRALCALDVPVLVQDHADNPDSRARVLRRWGLAKIAGVAFTSDEQARPFFENGTLNPRTPVFAIPESSTRFRPGDVEAARRETGLYGKPVVLWVGHLDENKDPLTIIDGFSRALDAIPDAHLWCCYLKAPLLEQVRARLARDGRLARHVHLLGAVAHDRVELLCRAADFFVLGSHRESCGFALLEAMACGAVPIVSDIPAFRAITGNAATGALCTPGDAENFSRALTSFSCRSIDDLRARALSHFEAELSFPFLGKKLAAAYQTILANYAARGNDRA
ncbi:MAG TPA: glycosyltransferase family 4 protein, partial [Rhizomicrobium sp.]